MRRIARGRRSKKRPSFMDAQAAVIEGGNMVL